MIRFLTAHSKISPHNVGGSCFGSRLQLSRSSSSLKITDEDRKRIYILGTSLRAVFIAAGLGSSSKRPPISLMTIDSRVYETFHHSGGSLRVIYDGEPPDTSVEVKQVQIELLPKQPIHSELEPPGQSESSPEEPPILNLIWCTRARYAYDAIHNVRHRLSRDSTVLFITSGMGILEKVMTQLFHDINSRPTFIQGCMTHVLMQDTPYKTSASITAAIKADGSRNDRAKIFEVHLRKQRGAKPFHLLIAPPIILSEDRKSQVRRITASKYVINKLLRAPLLNAKESFSKRDVLIHQWRRLIMTSISSVLGVYFECASQDIFKTEEGRHLGMRLAQEAHNVLRRHLPYVPLSEIHRWMQMENRSSGGISRTLIHVKTGKETDLQFNNQWLVDRGKLLGLECPTHVRMINMVNAKLEQARSELKKKEQERQEKADERAQEREKKRDEYRLDPIEIKRLKKAQRQKEMLGKQPMPSHIASPEIPTLGNTRIERGPVSSRNCIGTSDF